MNIKGYINWTAVFAVLIFSGSLLAQTGGLVYHEVQIEDEFGRDVTDITSVSIYAPGTTNTQTIYKDAALSLEITQPMTTTSTNTTLSSGKFYWYGADGWDFTVTDGTNTHGNYGHNSLNSSMGKIIFPSYLQSISSTTYSDAQTATFGSDSDFVLQGGLTGDRFTVTPHATDESAAWWFGANTSGVDVFFYAATTGDYVQWDADDEAVEWVGAQAHFDDDSDIQVGSDKDWTIDSETTKVLDFTPLAGDESYIINIGADEAGADLKLFASTSGDYLLWDASDEALEAVGAQIHLDDDSPLYLGSTAGDIKLQFDGSDFLIDASTTDEAMKIGDTTTGFDVHYYFEGAGEFLTDYDGDFIDLTDDMDLRFGTGASSNGDFQISSGATNILAIEQVVADTGTMTIGADDTDIPLTWYAETSGAELLLTGNTATFDGMSLRLNDDDALYFGDSGEAFKFEYDEDGTDNLLVTAAAANDAVQFGDGTTATDVIFQSTADASAQVQFDASGDTANGEWLFGADGHGIDVTFYGATASQKAWWDQSGDTWYYGANAEGVDVYFYADTDGNYMLWDENGDTDGALIFEDSVIRMNDDTQIQFGDSGEMNMEYDESGYDCIIVKGAIIPDSSDPNTHTANWTFNTDSDVGTWHLCATDGVVFTLPAVATGLVYKVMNTGADGVVEIHVDTDGSDMILGGCGFEALDDGDKLTNTKTTADRGDYVIIAYGTAAGWYIIDKQGTWADGGA